MTASPSRLISRTRRSLPAVAVGMVIGAGVVAVPAAAKLGAAHDEVRQARASQSTAAADLQTAKVEASAAQAKATSALQDADALRLAASQQATATSDASKRAAHDRKIAGQGPVADGIYLIGDGISVGTYRSVGGVSCYYARLGGPDHVTDVIENNVISTGPAVVTVKSTDYAFETRGCAPWERVSGG